LVSKILGLALLSKADNAGVNESAGSRAAFYQRWSGVSIRWMKVAFSFLSARLHAPGKWGR
jgi:hypothetical protein